MSYYNYIAKYCQAANENMLPEICSECEADGYSDEGVCKRCLKNIAKNHEWIDTHNFIYEDKLRCYHNDDHDYFKSAKRRLPGERPRLYYGIEVEVEFDGFSVCDAMNGYEDDVNTVRDILSEFSEITQGLFVYEEDGSLENGIEFISRPCSYAYWTSPENVERLRKGFAFLKENGAWEDQPIRNGLHIHISKAFFSAPVGTKDKKQAELDCYKDFDWLFQIFQDQLEMIGGRKYSPQYSASKKDRIKATMSPLNIRTGGAPFELETKVKLKKGALPTNGDHSWAVNSTFNTIEARTFKSTTDVDLILSYIEIMRNFSHAVREGQIHDTLNGILHTKENQFLDKTLKDIAIKAKKARKKFDLDEQLKDEIEFKVKSR